MRMGVVVGSTTNMPPPRNVTNRFVLKRDNGADGRIVRAVMRAEVSRIGGVDGRGRLTGETVRSAAVSEVERGGRVVCEFVAGGIVVDALLELAVLIGDDDGTAIDGPGGSVRRRTCGRAPWAGAFRHRSTRRDRWPRRREPCICRPGSGRSCGAGRHWRRWDYWVRRWRTIRPDRSLAGGSGPALPPQDPHCSR